MIRYGDKVYEAQPAVYKCQRAGCFCKFIAIVGDVINRGIGCPVCELAEDDANKALVRSLKKKARNGRAVIRRRDGSYGTEDLDAWRQRTYGIPGVARHSRRRA